MGKHLHLMLVLVAFVALWSVGEKPARECVVNSHETIIRALPAGYQNVDVAAFIAPTAEQAYAETAVVACPEMPTSAEPETKHLCEKSTLAGEPRRQKYSSQPAPSIGLRPALNKLQRLNS